MGPGAGRSRRDRRSLAGAGRGEPPVSRRRALPCPRGRPQRPRGGDDPSRPVQLPVPCRATPGLDTGIRPWASRDWRRFARHRGRSVSWLAAGRLGGLVSILLGVPARRGSSRRPRAGGSGRRDPSRTPGGDRHGWHGRSRMLAILEDPTVGTWEVCVPHHAPRGPGGSPARLGARRVAGGDGDASRSGERCRARAPRTRGPGGLLLSRCRGRGSARGRRFA